MSELARCTLLDVSHLKTGDKKPSWDGDIYLYPNRTRENTGELRKIPTQIKGTDKRQYAKNGKFIYDIEKKHLLNYKRHRGVLFFVGLVNETAYKLDAIYYADLSVVKLHRILLGKQHIKRNTKIPIEFGKLSTDPQQIEQLLINFSYIRDALAGFDNAKIEIDNIPNKELIRTTFHPTGDTMPTNNPLDLVGKTFNVTYEFDDGDYRILDTQITIGTVVEHPVKIKKSISINGEKYFEEVETRQTTNGLEVKFGKCISTTYPFEDNFKLNSASNELLRKAIVNISVGKGETFEERINAMRFLIAAIENKGYEINDMSRESFAYIDKTDPLYIKLKSELEVCTKIETLFKMLHIPLSIDLTTLSDNDNIVLNNLIYLLIEDGTAILKEDAPVVFINAIGKYKFALQNQRPLKGSEGKVITFPSPSIKENVFLTTKDEYRNEVKYVIPCYYTIHPEMLVQLTNIDFDDVYSEYVKMSDENPHKYEILQNFCLNILKSCDEGCYNKDKALLLVQKLVELEISNHGEDPLLLINLFQIYKRSRKLTAKERQKLIEIMDNNNDYEYKTGVCLLLDNQEQAEYYFSKMEKASKDLFVTWPIYYFWNYDAS